MAEYLYGFCDVLVLTAQELRQYTNDFSEDNFLGRTQFGKLYRGKILHDSNQTEAHEVIVKTWEFPPRNDFAWWGINTCDQKSRLVDELDFLQDPNVKNHPNLVKVIGFSDNGEPLGVVYDINPRDTLHNLMVEDTFTWLQRIKVALGLARLLDFLHSHDLSGKPYLVRNIDAAHILIDQDFNPILCDFGMLSGGIFGNLTKAQEDYFWGALGYTDTNLVSVGGWSNKRDVFSYGVVLLSIIAKRVVDKAKTGETVVHVWAKKEYKPKKKSFLNRKKAKCSLVHNSLEKDPTYDIRDGYKITELAMSCVEFNPLPRPTMSKIVKTLEDLNVTQSHSEAVGLKPVVNDA